MTDKEVRASLLEAFVIKSTTKQKVYQNTKKTFTILKKVLKKLEEDYLSIVREKVPSAVLPVFKERGPFEVEFKIGGDLLIFSMHSNVFEFDDKHPAWKTAYVEEDSMRSYCGTINIYNFLADSFKYNRNNDLGYLVARIFVNKDNHFFVEGKRQSDETVKDFAIDTISPGLVRQIVETAIQYSIEFDLLVPLYDQVKVATVDQMRQKISHSKMTTGKRLGFEFNSDDV
ncbi:MAG: hypothetical protein HN778_12005 [Prolixibacteraceae bacterium]|jgi:hypothetical protein|nr:hypothetical protein [Prolixibacteraceae bacterium]MBT6006385.1 hypothetical protein [Prolixibacteraceae bacterium]MBT6766028.1 hypothetical protein [Prolixibacteraceae bacterium]MBT7000617.1 hypothetical protein [Prolixibacteraceae bacterium]MBT7395549.1 hypothetical protein [Prolixibacteraceae bacterium]